MLLRFTFTISTGKISGYEHFQRVLQFSPAGLVFYFILFSNQVNLM